MSSTETRDMQEQHRTEPYAAVADGTPPTYDLGDAPARSLPFVTDASGLRLFSVDELAQMLGQSPRWVYRQREERGMPALMIGRSLLFQLPAVTAWLERHQVGDWGPAGDGR
jgi:excisionase family DNA binding protein